MTDNRAFYFTGKTGRGDYYATVSQGGACVSHQTGFADRHRAYRYARHMAQLCARRHHTTAVASCRS